MRKAVAVAVGIGALIAPTVGQAAQQRVTGFEFRGVVTADATADAMQIEVRGANRAAWMSLAGAKSFTVKLSPNTRIVGVREAKRRSFVSLKAGDRVTVIIVARRGTTAPNLSAARFVVDRGVARNWTPPVVTPPVDPTPVEPPTPTEPPVDPIGQIG